MFRFIWIFICCFLSGAMMGAGAISIDHARIKFGILMILLGFISVCFTVCYIVIVFKSIHIESRLSHMINSVYTDID